MDFWNPSVRLVHKSRYRTLFGIAIIRGYNTSRIGGLHTLQMYRKGQWQMTCKFRSQVAYLNFCNFNGNDESKSKVHKKYYDVENPQMSLEL